MRKKGSNGQESRARLLEAAAQEFARSGYHETKISTIVSRAGLTQPSFYLYFQSKEAIFEELMELFEIQFKEMGRHSREEPDDPDNVGQEGNRREAAEGQMYRELAGLFGFLGKNQDLTQIGFFTGTQSAALKRRLMSAIHSDFAAKQQNGHFRHDADMEIAAECLLGTIECLTREQLLTGKRPPEELAQEVVRLYLLGLMA
ncbi:TetR/AcrR family transcriptional regulator [Paenibacillus sp. F411]|uniref:TetR/AcrR family transcriptional regulator n=1 Tax=Paenibacillus sp. F411 TaxID=2820239 RepID=UPI001AAED75D|nr:TetR/AcrR family transcriptional regulator [Paenibacillus sp. F411]MBO2944032.1 TetR/AcrR family transcriptional regulator [Paenibacillus sp. F411]